MNKYVFVSVITLFLSATYVGCKNNSNHSLERDATVYEDNNSYISNNDSIVEPAEVSNVQQAASNEDVPFEKMPKTAVRQKSAHLQYAVYINEDSPSANEGDTEPVSSVWLVDEKKGTVRKVCVTNPSAEAQWERMKSKNADAVNVPISMIADADNAFIAPGDVNKVIVEGCPDGRNVWTYIIDTVTHTAKQFPSTEGVVSLNWDKKEIVLAFYGYDDEGRYSYSKVYSIDGKFLREVGNKERE